MLVASDDPHYDKYVELRELGLCKLVEVENTGCEALSKYLHDYVNDIFLPTHYPNHSGQEIHCRLVRVQETPANSAWYESRPGESDLTGSVAADKAK